MTRTLLAALALAALSTGCESRPREPMTLDGNLLTVDNRSAQEWRGVEIWINTYYRVTTPSIAAGGRFQAPLDVFVAGFGQRFDFHRTQVRDVRLVAKLPDGKPLEIRKSFEAGGLPGTLGRAVGAEGKR